ncbi:hybrid sensor histidine kinase/response regulator [Nitrosospira sp. Nsp13]|uniref:hybrid sensor histidine kinase/response regulator n=1 Tax=Nitrosospira sp. Nsp13 TaxID=1855332 RepID=UPI0008892055|nr:hybrid sensor histidine kinase/response regulator [Nitrosospira sp. Nsp13]SCY48746.1 CheA signal transduction histidine kinase [Nitrosospira sp. Nsp13]
MISKNDELLKKLLATFQVEADAHLQAMSSGLLALKKIPVGQQLADIVERIFRDAHSLKGAARAVNLTQIEAVCQSLENVFSALKDKHLPVSSPLIDLLLQTTDALSGLLTGANSVAGAQKPRVATLIRQLDDALREPLSEFANPALAPQMAPPDQPTPLPPDVPAEPDKSMQMLTSTPGLASTTVRVSATKLDAVMRQVEELLLPRLAVNQRTKELSEAAAMLAAWKRQRLHIQPALRLVDREFARNIKDGSGSRRKLELPQLLKYLDAEQLHMKMLEDRLASLQRAAEQDQRVLAGMTDSLRHDVKEMQLLPFSSLLDILPRLCRELAREQGKNVDLVIQGGEIEIDRHILEEMKDPLIHLVRNCIDHGIEQPAARLVKGKPSHGTITLACSQKDGGMAEVLVADDGAGINIPLIKAAAHKLGIVSTEEAKQLGERESMTLVFQSGVTTSPIITDISGRGLGLPIVSEKVERLGGTILVKSSPDEGTAFHLLLPLTLANFRGVLIHAGGQLFVIPSTSVERVVRIANKEIRTVENRETILVDEQPVSLVWLSDVLELPRHVIAVEPAGGTSSAPIVVLGSGVARVAFLVEEILGEQEVLVKTLVRPLTRVRNVAGATVLGTGRVVPVLNVADLLKSATKRPARILTSAHQLSAEKHENSRKLSILVVEDSITSRTLLKNILESAGYRVSTAVDGVDGYTTLKTGKFDLVVSDVEMPRMDGFGLTAKIRTDKQCTGLPVVLVTALESRDHRERGVDAGANAYIVKSSFDQSNLLEIVQRLIGIPS